MNFLFFMFFAFALAGAVSLFFARSFWNVKWHKRCSYLSLFLWIGSALCFTAHIVWVFISDPMSLQEFFHSPFSILLTAGIYLAMLIGIVLSSKEIKKNLYL